MKIVRGFHSAVLVLITVFGLAGCAQPDTSPIIDNLVYEYTKMPVQEGATGNVTGTFDIEHTGAETESVNAVVYDSQGKQVSTNSIPLSDTLRTQKMLAFLVEISLAKKADYTFQVFILDSKGRQSNRLTGTFAVTDLF